MKRPTAALEQALRRTEHGAEMAQSSAAGRSEARTPFSLSRCLSLVVSCLFGDELSELVDSVTVFSQCGPRCVRSQGRAMALPRRFGSQAFRPYEK